MTIISKIKITTSSSVKRTLGLFSFNPNMRHFLLALLVAFSFSMLFYFTYLFKYQGYAGFNNFLIPLTSNGLNWAVIFNPLQYDTVPITTPQSSLYGLIFVTSPLWLMAHISTVNDAARSLTGKFLVSLPERLYADIM